MEISYASENDLTEILDLQKLAYQSEAIIYNDFSIAPLIQILKELQDEAKKGVILKAVENERIIGSVRAYESGGTCFIGKLIVHPDYQNRGIGRMLMREIEKCYKVDRYELFTGYLSRKNISLYEKLGYNGFKTEKVADNLKFVFMERRTLK